MGNADMRKIALLAMVSAYHRAKSGALRSPPTWGVVSVPAPLPQSQ
jgi:hypothetical protein